MALAPIVNPKPLSEIKKPDEKIDSELSDAFVKELKKLSKKKDYSKDPVMPQALVLPPLVPLQDRKAQLGKQGSNTEQVQFPSMRDSVLIKEELKRNVIHGSNTEQVQFPGMTDSVLIKEELKRGVITTALQSRPEDPSTLAQPVNPLASAESIPDEAVVSPQNNRILPEEESVKLEKREARNDLAPTVSTIIPYVQSATIQQVSSGSVSQEQWVASQEVARQQIETLVARDKHITASAETKFNFAWGGNQSVVIAGTAETGYKLRASDNQVKQILDRHLDAQGSASSLGIMSVETATDKQPKQHQSTNHNHTDDADE